MARGIYNYSEIGKLNRALLHRPGAELEALTPDTLQKMLFEDIPFLSVSKREHDDFAKLLKDNGVQVMYYVDEAAKALADLISDDELSADYIIPAAFDKRVGPAVAAAVAQAARDSGVARI